MWAHSRAERAVTRMPPGTLCTIKQTIGKYLGRLGRAVEAEAYLQRTLELVAEEGEGEAERFRLVIACDLGKWLESLSKASEPEAFYRAEIARTPPSLVETSHRRGLRLKLAAAGVTGAGGAAAGRGLSHFARDAGGSACGRGRRRHAAAPG